MVQVQLPHTSDDDLIWGMPCFLGFWKSEHSFRIKGGFSLSVFYLLDIRFLGYGLLGGCEAVPPRWGEI